MFVVKPLLATEHVTFAIVVIGWVYSDQSTKTDVSTLLKDSDDHNKQ